LLIAIEFIVTLADKNRLALDLDKSPHLGNFEQNILKNELQYLISGSGKKSQRNLIQAAANHIKKGKGTGSKIGTTKRSKSEEAQGLV
jgi:hypothetical protein